MADQVTCSFHIRTAADGGWHYDPIFIAGPFGDGDLRTEQPPLVGDLIWLWNNDANGPGMCRVIEREWQYSAYGSANWPLGSQRPSPAPRLNCIVESAEGMFQDEVARQEPE